MSLLSAYYKYAIVGLLLPVTIFLLFIVLVLFDSTHINSLLQNSAFLIFVALLPVFTVAAIILRRGGSKNVILIKFLSVAVGCIVGYAILAWFVLGTFID